MERIITVKRSSLNQESVIKYDESSTDDNLIKKKELTIKSLSALQLLIVSLDSEQSSELSEMITVLEDTYAEIEMILGIAEDKDDFYEDYLN